MILECPSCRARYLVQIGLFAQGGRKVRCARCKHEWHATLPTNIDVVSSPPEYVPPPPPPKPFAEAPVSPQDAGAEEQPVEAVAGEPAFHPTHLPVVIDKRKWLRKLAVFGGCAVLVAALVAWPIMDRGPIVKVLPGLRGFYEALGLQVPFPWDGLLFQQVKSELRYDGGTMKLFVDGIIHNSTSEVQLIPDIMARALGPDRQVVQSWSVEAPAVTILAGEDIPFHTEVASTMEHTIEDLSLQFYAREEKSNASTK